jgi:hypothetical protein
MHWKAHETKKKERRKGKSSPANSLRGSREVAGYETPVGFLRSADGARIERVTSQLLRTRIS